MKVDMDTITQLKTRIANLEAENSRLKNEIRDIPVRESDKVNLALNEAVALGRLEGQVVTLKSVVDKLSVALDDSIKLRDKALESHKPKQQHTEGKNDE